MAELIEKVCPVCGIVYGLERTFYDYRRNGSASKSERGWHCPNGHSLIVRKTKADELQEQLDAERRRRQSAEQNIEYQRQQRQRAERSAIAYKGQATKLRNRSKAGVCPCCNRTFQQLARHMANKHPTFAANPDGDLPEGVPPVLAEGQTIQ